MDLDLSQVRVSLSLGRIFVVVVKMRDLKKNEEKILYNSLISQLIPRVCSINWLKSYKGLLEWSLWREGVWCIYIYIHTMPCLSVTQ